MPRRRIPRASKSARARLEVTDELALKNRALEAAAEGISIADARLPDNPLIYANSGFARLTGYSVKESVGCNCRFLQGGDTDQLPGMLIQVTFTCTLDLRGLVLAAEIQARHTSR